MAACLHWQKTQSFIQGILMGVMVCLQSDYNFIYFYFIDSFIFCLVVVVVVVGKMYYCILAHLFICPLNALFFKFSIGLILGKPGILVSKV